MQAKASRPDSPTSQSPGFIRRIREFKLIGRDPVLFMSLLISGIFIFVFVIFPLFRSVVGGFISKEGNFDLTYFARYFDDYYGPALRKAFLDTMLMGLMTASSGTIRLVLFLLTPSYVVISPVKRSSTGWRWFPPFHRPLHWL